MPHRITLIPGDSTAPEITEASIRVLEAAGVQFEGGDSAISQISQLDERDSISRISEGFGIPLNTLSGPPDRPCAEAHSRERQ